MLYGLLVTLFVLICLLLALLVLIQRGKGSMGIGTMGGGTQMLFGGSGGQDIFQKTTWILGALFMAGSLGLGLLKSKSLYTARFTPQEEEAAASLPQTAPEMPTTPTQEAPKAPEAK